MLKGLADIDKEILLAFAECDMNVSKAARKCYVERTAAAYHLEKIKMFTGLNPFKFYDLVRLLGFTESNRTLLAELRQAKRIINRLCDKCGENVCEEGDQNGI